MTKLVSEHTAEHLRKGRDAEDHALLYLEQQGLHCLTRNFRSRYGEIDLVMSDHGTVVFVEVRYRRHGYCGGALASIDARKRARLKATAQWYLCIQSVHGPVRFDVVAVEPEQPGGRWDCVWIRDAIQDD